MGKFVTKILCVIVIFCTMFTFTTSADNSRAYTYNFYQTLNGVRLYSSANQAYIVGYKDNKAYIDAVYPNKYSITLNLNNNIRCVNMFNGKLVLGCADYDFNQSKFAIYDIQTDTLNYIDFPQTNILYCDNFALCKNTLYILKNANTVEMFSIDGIHIGTCKSNVKLTSIFTNNESIYATATNGVYKLNYDSFLYISNTTLFPCVSFVSKDIAIDDNGGIYKLTNSVSKITSQKSTSLFPCGGVYSDYILVSQSNSLYAINKSDTSKKKVRSVTDFIEQICVVNDKVITLSKDSNLTVSIIPFSDFTDIKDKENQSDSKTHAISSEAYKVDYDNRYILDIPHNTTVAKFKKNMNFDGYNVELTRYDGKALKSGKIGTGTIARFYNEYSSYEYALSVIGDVTGEGNVNTRDVRLIMREILELVEFSGVFSKSANIYENDGDITVYDAYLVYQMYLHDKK